MSRDGQVRAGLRTVLGLDEIIAMLDRVTPEDVRDAGRGSLAPDRLSLAVHRAGWRGGKGDRRLTDGIRVGVCGYAGRKGSHVVRAVQQADGMTFVGGADVAAAAAEETERSSRPPWTRCCGRRVRMSWWTSPCGLGVRQESVVLEAAVHSVVGNTGLTEAQRHELGRIAEKNGVGVLVARTSRGRGLDDAVCPAGRASTFSGVEIIELHHVPEAGRPSGTALMTAGKIAETWQGASVGGNQEARGLDANGIRVHSVRLPGLVAHQKC